MASQFPPAFARLKAVLDTELELLVSGGAAQVAGLIEEKMLALEAFEAAIASMDMSTAAPVVRDGVAEIVRSAQENAAHLEAVRNGMSSIIARMERLDGSSEVGSYGRKGAQLSFTNSTGSFDRRA